MKKKYSASYLILSVLILLGAFGVVQYYIWGNAFITEFHADCTDTLLWAQASLESGSLFKPTFDYAYRLAFGGQWLFMPFLRLFGVGMTALRAGMCLFACLFTLALILFFRSMRCQWGTTFFSAALMLLAVCATKKMREIFFGHVIHYSLAVFYLLIAFVLIHWFFQGKTAGQKIPAAVLLIIWLFMCSANGTVQMLYVTLPLLAGCVIEFYLNRERELPVLGLCICLAAAAGLLFSRSLNTNYSDSYSVIVPAEDWAENLLLFPQRWISLFYELPVKKLDAFTPQWLKTVFKTVTALLMLFGTVLSIPRLRTLKHPEERLFTFTAWAMFAGFLFFFVFGKISDVDWRLSPLVFSAQAVILLLLRHFSDQPQERTLSGGAVLLCSLALIANAFSNGFTVLRIPYDQKIWYAEDGLLETLRSHELEYGYVTSYWLSNSITVLSGNEICPRYIAWGDEGPYLLPFNSDMDWYDDRPEEDRYFVAVKESEYDPESAIAKEASVTYTCFQEDTRNSVKENYVIMVLNRNIMKAEYDRLIDRYR